MPSKDEMAKAYIAQVEAQLAQLKSQVEALEKHLQECNSEIGDSDE